MILPAINAKNFTQSSKILCIFAELLERNQRFILDFFTFGEKIEELGSRALPLQHPLFQ
jgi:hypothetical protein